MNRKMETMKKFVKIKNDEWTSNNFVMWCRQKLIRNRAGKEMMDKFDATPRARFLNAARVGILIGNKDVMDVVEKYFNQKGDRTMLKVNVDWDLELDGEGNQTLEKAGVQEIMEIPDDVIADILEGFLDESSEMTKGSIQDFINNHPDRDDILRDIADWLSDEYGWCVNDLQIVH